MSKKVEVLNKIVETLGEVKQTLTDVELGKTVSTYDTMVKVENITEVLEVLKSLIFWEEKEQELILLKLEPVDPRISTQIHFYDVEQLQQFVAEYKHYKKDGVLDIFFKSFININGMPTLDRIKYDLQRNRNEALGIVNYHLDQEYQYTTGYIDEVVENINQVLEKNNFFKNNRNNA